MIEIEWAGPPPGRPARRSRDGATRTRKGGRPVLVTETGDRYVAPAPRYEHGTRTCYVLDRCRCAPCTIASREEERARRTRAEAINVPADAAREHVRAMMGLGFGYQHQSRVTGVPEQTYQNLLYGGWRVKDGVRIKRPPARRIRKANAQRMLAFRPPEDDPPDLEHRHPRSRVPSAPTLRRWDELVERGWRVVDVLRATGIDRQNIDRLNNERPPTVSAATAIAIRTCWVMDTWPERPRGRWA